MFHIHKLEYKEYEEPKKKMQFKIIWFNPPYSMNHKTMLSGCLTYILLYIRSKVVLIVPILV